MSKVKVSDWVSQWESEWVSEWQGHLLSCCGQLKKWYLWWYTRMNRNTLTNLPQKRKPCQKWELFAFHKKKNFQPHCKWQPDATTDNKIFLKGRKIFSSCFTSSILEVESFSSCSHCLPPPPRPFWKNPLKNAARWLMGHKNQLYISCCEICLWRKITCVSVLTWSGSV